MQIFLTVQGDLFQLISFTINYFHMDTYGYTQVILMIKIKADISFFGVIIYLVFKREILKF